MSEGPTASDQAVAVVIPCYNAAATLAGTLESVRAQTRAPAEVVVVDDGSSDGSAAVAEAAGARCVRQARRGPGAARNRGIAETRSPWVAFLDADDQFTPDKLAKQLDHLRRTGAVMSCTDARISRGTYLEGRKNARYRVPATLTLETLLAFNPVICSSVVIARDTVQAAGGFDEDPALIATEDYDLWLRAAQHGPIAYLDEPLVLYLVWEGSLSDDRRFVLGIDRIMAKLLASGSGPSDVAKLAAKRRAGVRVSAAYHLARRGEGREARALLREARRLDGWSREQLRVWLRSWMSPRSSPAPR